MSTPPDWLESLANAAAERIQGADVLAPLGCHYHDADGTWEVTLFASLTEVVGGPRDGVLRRSKFSVDLIELSRLFTKLYGMNWQAQPFSADDELGAHVSVEGIYRGHDVCLRILASPPKRFPVGRRANAYEPAWEDLW